MCCQEVDVEGHYRNYRGFCLNRKQRRKQLKNYLREQ